MGDLAPHLEKKGSARPRKVKQARLGGKVDPVQAEQGDRLFRVLRGVVHVAVAQIRLGDGRALARSLQARVGGGQHRLEQLRGTGSGAGQPETWRAARTPQLCALTTIKMFAHTHTHENRRAHTHTHTHTREKNRPA